MITSHKIGVIAYLAAIAVNCYVMFVLGCSMCSIPTCVGFMAIVMAYMAGQLTAVED